MSGCHLETQHSAGVYLLETYTSPDMVWKKLQFLSLSGGTPWILPTTSRLRPGVLVSTIAQETHQLQVTESSCPIVFPPKLKTIHYAAMHPHVVDQLCGRVDSHSSGIRQMEYTLFGVPQTAIIVPCINALGRRTRRYEWLAAESNTRYIYINLPVPGTPVEKPYDIPLAIRLLSDRCCAKHVHSVEFRQHIHQATLVAFWL